MAEILIGTSGYSYPEWVGPFYPEGSRSEEFLAFYAQRFDTVELNFSYYRMPQGARLALMHQEAPNLLFSLKAHQSLTHTIDPSTYASTASTFAQALEPLASKNVLLAVLLQFPPSFTYTVDHRYYLDSLTRILGHLPLAVEFRSPSWSNKQTLDGLRNRGVCFVSVDLPQVAGTPPLLDVRTCDLGYVRLHGRNKEAWWGSSDNRRYDYLYSASELASIASRVAFLAEETKRVAVYFNNHHRGQAVANAQTLKTLL
ncbi:MAG: DUF72 domain-containing protein [Spirochaetales bacterium]|nr:DUF72 domain-containing protein [Spirochaetales bacterium]